MHVSQLHYWPLPLPLFSVLAGVFLVLVILLQVNALRYAHMRLGLSSRVALLLLLGSLVGSYINIPVAELAQQSVVASDAGQSIIANSSATGA